MASVYGLDRETPTTKTARKHREEGSYPVEHGGGSRAVVLHGEDQPHEPTPRTAITTLNAPIKQREEATYLSGDGSGRGLKRNNLQQKGGGEVTPLNMAVAAGRWFHMERRPAILNPKL